MRDCSAPTIASAALVGMADHNCVDSTTDCSLAAGVLLIEMSEPVSSPSGGGPRAEEIEVLTACARESCQG